MCGRFSMSVSEEQTILKRFDLKSIDFDLKPRYNIAPTQLIPAILDESPKVLSEVKWGLIPHWAKEEKTDYSMINARVETIDKSPAFKSSFQSKRCLIIADSFYEWKKVGKNKVPFRLMMKDESLFSFAGLWDEWQGTKTCMIITTEANEIVSKIHDRMPVILEKKSERRWLSDKPDKSLLKPYDSAKMKAYELNPLINSAQNESSDVIKPKSQRLLGNF